MEANIPCQKKIYKPIPSRRPLRAIIEISDDQYKIVPLADSDDDERRILDALRLMAKRFRQ